MVEKKILVTNAKSSGKSTQNLRLYEQMLLVTNVQEILPGL